MNHPVFWIVFAVMVAVMLALDLGVFHRKAHVIEMREALTWSAVWITIALLFNLAIWIWMEDGNRMALEYLACYLTEKSLSLDNIFVFVVIFRYFAVPPEAQHRVLFWGILGALVLRATFIWLGVELLERFEWTAYILGGFLVVTGIRLAFEKDKEVHPEKNPLLRICRRLFPVTSERDGSKLFIVRDGKRFATPLFMSLVVVETSDLVFAIDSVPAAIAITSDRFILYTSNVMAILGLRALYFALEGAIRKFHYLHYGLAAILVFVGVKMLLVHHLHVPIAASLAVIVGLMTVTILASVARPGSPSEVPRS